MTTISEKLIALDNAKEAIRASISAKGVAVSPSDPLASYPAFIDSINTGSSTPDNGWSQTAYDEAFSKVVYNRNPEWLPIDPPSNSVQKVMGLVAVSNDGANYIAFQATGDYTVDWGDGTVENYGGYSTAAHHYAFASLSGTTTTSMGYRQAVVTITPQSGNDLTSISFSIGYPGFDNVFSYAWLDLSISMPNVSTDPAAIAFSASSGWGPPVTRLMRLENVGLSTAPAHSENLFQNLTALRAVIILDSAPLANMSMMFANCVSLTAISLSTVSSVSDVGGMFNGCVCLVVAPMFNTAAVTNMNSMFNGCSSLSFVPLYDTTAVNAMMFMFAECKVLSSVPLFNTTAVTDMQYMFYNCSSLTSVPLFTAVNVNMQYMFMGCRSLSHIPLFNTAISNAQYMFGGCYSLSSVPLLDVSTAADLTGMFYECYSLPSVPLFDTSNVNNMALMFNGCRALSSVPLFNTAAVGDMQMMFQNCISLSSVPLFNTAAVTTMQMMFQNCSSLTSVPLFDTVSVIYMGSMFAGCISLSFVPLFNTIAVNDMNGMFSAGNASGLSALVAIPAFDTTAVTANPIGVFNNCYSLTSCGLAPSVDFGFTSSKMDRAALVALFTALPNVSGMTLTITGAIGLYGADPLTAGDRAIVTGKGWTLVE